MADYRLTPDGIQARQATKEELAYLQLAEDRLVQLRAPMLLEKTSDRVFVAAMDGTGNSIYKDSPEQYTIVGRLTKDIETLRNSAITVGYVEGIGTQTGYMANRIDSALAMTFQSRIEHAYYEFCVQAAKWIDEDPNVRIHLVGIGFSRGAEQVPALQRLIHERGILNPDNASIAYGPEGLLRNIKYADLPPLVPPGQTVQAALMLDPVATSLDDQDRRFPGSNVSVLGFIAQHDARDFFSATRHVSDGLSERGRVASFAVPGAHSDVGGAYLIDGSGRHIHNMGVDYLNAMFGRDLLSKVPVPLDPRLYVIHSSDQHQFGINPTGHYRQNGERRIHAGLSPACKETAPAPCTRDPVDHDLADTLQWRYVAQGRTPGGTDPKMDAALAAIDRMHARDTVLLDRVAARSTLPLRAELLVARDSLDTLFGQLADSAMRNSSAGMSAAAKAYMETPQGQVLKSALHLTQAAQHPPAPAMSHP